MTKLDRQVAQPVIDAIETIAQAQVGQLPEEQGLPRVREILQGVDQQQALDWALTFAAVLVNTCARSNDSEVTQEVRSLRESLSESWSD